MKRLLFALLLFLPTPALAAWSSSGSILTASNGSAGTSWAPTTSAQLTAGQVGVCVIGKDETGTGTSDGDNSQISGVSDAAGNTWNYVDEFDNMQTSTAADGAVVGVFYTFATSTLSSGAAITFSFSASTTRKAATCWAFNVAAGATFANTPSPDQRADDAADPGALTTSPGVLREYLWVRGTACETNSTAWTSDSDYTAFTHTSSTSNSGTASTSIGARGEWRIATEANSATSDPTWTSADCASVLVGIEETAPASTSYRSFWGNQW